MKIRYYKKVVDFEEHREIAGTEILDASNYQGFSPDCPKIEVKAFEMEKVKNMGMQKPFQGAFSINKNMRN